MKKEYKCLVSPKMLIYNIVRAFIITLFFGTLIFLAGNSVCEKILLMIGVCCIVFLVMYIPYRNMYAVAYISADGIRNRYLSISWTEIKEYKLYEYNEIGKYPKIKFPMIVCIGDTSKGGWWGYSPKKAICFSLTRENLKKIENFCDDKNDIIIELLSWSNIPI